MRPLIQTKNTSNSTADKGKNDPKASCKRLTGRPHVAPMMSCICPKATPPTAMEKKKMKLKRKLPQVRVNCPEAMPPIKAPAPRISPRIKAPRELEDNLKK